MDCLLVQRKWIASTFFFETQQLLKTSGKDVSRYGDSSYVSTDECWVQQISFYLGGSVYALGKHI
jgi:hypothetical protein